MAEWDIRMVRNDGSSPGGHYTVNSINGDAMHILRGFEPNDINWVFLSTSGVHGCYTSLDQIEWYLWDGDENEVRKELFAETEEDWERPSLWDVTVLIVLPRMVTTLYGNAIVRTREDAALLRGLVERTFSGIEELQKGNRARPRPRGEHRS